MVQKDDDNNPSLIFHYIYPDGREAKHEQKLEGVSNEQVIGSSSHVCKIIRTCIQKEYKDNCKTQEDGKNYEIEKCELKNVHDDKKTKISLMPLQEPELNKDSDYQLFEQILEEKIKKLNIGDSLPEVFMYYESEPFENAGAINCDSNPREKSFNKYHSRYPENNEENDARYSYSYIRNDQIKDYNYTNDYNYANNEANEEKKIFYNNTEEAGINYVGLVNQAMTCYLNSLLQALYMTPEFRNALYNWEFKNKDRDAEANSIPFQLQKLFLNLQTSHKKAVETTSLTRSFGWDVSDSWLQHDIQELCRVMFDALEHKFKNTAQADLINRLYEGKIIDYVKCLSCNTEKTREDTFLDIPLPVRPFDNTVAYGSVEEALEAFVKYETLEGNNQYFCEKCDKKSDAHKGLKFTKFPYILTLQLKRFDFDHNTYNRIKLNDKVTFPGVLNLNRFIESATTLESPSREEDAGMSMKGDDSSTTDSSIMGDECISNDLTTSNSNHLINNDQDIDEGVDVSNGMSSSYSSDNPSTTEKLRKEYSSAKGPYIYELFSIMIHSGSASGGHYYVYIKDFRTNKWWQFNDQQVTPITSEEIQKSYGGGVRGCYSAAYRSSTNAYMLMYRQIEPELNTFPMEAKDFPPHIKDLLEKMKKEEEQSYHDEQMSLTSRHRKYTVYFRHPRTKEVDKTDISFNTGRTLAQIADIARKKFGLEDEYTAEQCRIVSYYPYFDIVDVTYDGKEDTSLSDIADSQPGMRELLLDVRLSDEFDVYPSQAIITKVYVLDAIDKDLVYCPKYIRAYTKQTVKQFKQELSKYFAVDPNTVQLYSSDILPNKLLEDDFVFDTLNTATEYVISATDTYPKDMKQNFLESAFFKMNEYLNEIISFYIDTSEVNKAQLKRMNIPTLADYKEEKVQNKISNFYNCSDKLPKLNNDVDSFKNSNERSIQDPLDSYQRHVQDQKQIKKDSGYQRRIHDLKPVRKELGQNRSAQITDNENPNDHQKFSTSLNKVNHNRSASPIDKQNDSKSSAAERHTKFLASQTAHISEKDENIHHVENESVQTKENKKRVTKKVYGNKSPCASEHDLMKVSDRLKNEQFSTQETSNSEDSSLSDSDRTLVGDVPEECDLNFEFPIEVKNSDDEEEDRKCFRAERTKRFSKLRVSIDTGMTEEELKKNLEPFLDIPREYFRITECSGLNMDDNNIHSGNMFDNLVFKEDQVYPICLERKINSDECKVDVYSLEMDSIEPLTKSFTMVLKKLILMKEAKQQIFSELKSKGAVSLPIDYNVFDKCRFMSIENDIVDEELRDNDNLRTSDIEICIQKIPDDVDDTQSLIYMCSYDGSKTMLGPPRPITVDNENFNDQVKQKISTLSSIPAECLEFYPLAASKSISFPNIESGPWKSDLTVEDVDHKTYLLYRDSADKLDSRSSKPWTYGNQNRTRRRQLEAVPINSSPRKEKALKIRVGST